MPLIGTGGTLSMQLHVCRGWHTVDDFASAMVEMLRVSGAVPLNPVADLEEVEGIGKVRSRICLTDLPEFLEQTQRLESNWDRPEFTVETTEHLRLWIRPKFVGKAEDLVSVQEDLPVMVNASRYGDSYSVVTVRAELSPRAAEDQSLTTRFGEALAEQMVEWAEVLVATLQPEYLWCAEDDENYENISGQQVVERRLDTVYWFNFFSGTFLGTHHKQAFATCPVGSWREEAGGFVYSLHPMFQVNDRTMQKRIEGVALGHLQSIGIHRIQWTFEIT